MKLQMSEDGWGEWRSSMLPSACPHIREYMTTNINERSLANKVSPYQYIPLSKAMFMWGMHLLIQFMLAKTACLLAWLSQAKSGTTVTPPHPTVSHHTFGCSPAGKSSDRKTRGQRNKSGGCARFQTPDLSSEGIPRQKKNCLTTAFRRMGWYLKEIKTVKLCSGWAAMWKIRHSPCSKGPCVLL